ncbi:MAG: hypothetical protein WBG57_13525 [Ornithinimicrobium sp.]
MRATIPRIAIGALGLALALWGLWLISGSADSADVVNIALWLGGGVIAHDGLIAGITLGVAAIATRVLPRVARAPATVGLVVIGTITVVAIPFLGRFGAREDNPTLLDRNYTAGYLGIVAIVVACVVIATMIRARRDVDREDTARADAAA